MRGRNFEARPLGASTFQLHRQLVIFAAKIKSFSERPPMARVQISIRLCDTLPGAGRDDAAPLLAPWRGGKKSIPP